MKRDLPKSLIRNNDQMVRFKRKRTKQFVVDLFRIFLEIQQVLNLTLSIDRKSADLVFGRRKGYNANWLIPFPDVREQFAVNCE